MEKGVGVKVGVGVVVGVGVGVRVGVVVGGGGCTNIDNESLASMFPSVSSRTNVALCIPSLNTPKSNLRSTERQYLSYVNILVELRAPSRYNAYLPNHLFW